MVGLYSYLAGLGLAWTKIKVYSVGSLSKGSEKQSDSKLIPPVYIDQFLVTICFRSLFLCCQLEAPLRFDAAYILFMYLP